MLPTSLTLARIIVAVVLFCLPFVIFVVLSEKPDNAMYFLFPIFGAVPAILAAVILFMPIEAALDARGMADCKNFAVPLAGAMIFFLVIIIIGLISGNLGAMFARIVKAGWLSLLPWSFLGALWGLVWRSTEWLANWVGLTHV
jgi:hypothetical protein